MLLSEGQINDYKGAALMIDAFPKASPCLATRVMTQNGFAKPSPDARLRLAFRQRPTAKSRSTMIKPSTVSAQDRKHVRQAQGLAPHPYPLRPMRPHIHARNLHRSCGHLLALINES